MRVHTCQLNCAPYFAVPPARPVPPVRVRLPVPPARPGRTGLRASGLRANGLPGERASGRTGFRANGLASEGIRRMAFYGFKSFFLISACGGCVWSPGPSKLHPGRQSISRGKIGISGSQIMQNHIVGDLPGGSRTRRSLFHSPREAGARRDKQRSRHIGTPIVGGGSWCDTQGFGGAKCRRRAATRSFKAEGMEV